MGLTLLQAQPETTSYTLSTLQAYFGEELSEDVVGAIASEKNPPSPPVSGGAKETYSHYPSTLTGKGGSEFPQRLEAARQIRDLLMQTGDELTNLLRGLNGEYIIVSRMLEVNGQGLWQPDAEKLDKLRELYEFDR
jgi:magnesium chelatase subunit H